MSTIKASRAGHLLGPNLIVPEYEVGEDLRELRGDLGRYGDVHYSRGALVAAWVAGDGG